MAIKLRPLSDRLVVKPDRQEEMTEHGIFVPQIAQQRPQTGTVLSAGPGYVSEFPVISEKWPAKVNDRGESMLPEQLNAEFKRMPMHVREGDRILFGKYDGVEIEIERDKFIILRQTEVLALLEQDEDETVAAS